MGDKNDGPFWISRDAHPITKFGGPLRRSVDSVKVCHPAVKVEPKPAESQLLNLCCRNVPFRRNVWPQKELLRAEHTSLGDRRSVIRKIEVIRQLGLCQNKVDPVLQISGGYLSDIIHSATKFELWRGRDIALSIILRRSVSFPRGGYLYASALRQDCRLGCNPTEFSLMLADNPETMCGDPEGESKAGEYNSSKGGDRPIILPHRDAATGGVQFQPNDGFDKQVSIFVKGFIGLAILMILYAVPERF